MTRLSSDNTPAVEDETDSECLLPNSMCVRPIVPSSCTSKVA
jgi:hypothetical protein